MFLDHLRLELKTGRSVLLPPEEWEQIRRARKYGHGVEDGLYTTEDIYGLKIAFDPRLVAVMTQVTEGGLQKARDLQDHMNDILEDDDGVPGL